MKKHERLAKRDSKPAGRQRLAVDDRRAQLLALGAEAFAAAPYDQVSIDDIATRAGISRGLLFHYFPTKRDFYVEVIAQLADRMLLETFVEAPARQSPPALAALLARGLDAYFAYVENYAEAFATLLRAGGEEGAQDVVDRTRLEYVRRLRAYLPEDTGIPEAQLRASLSAWERLVEGLALDWVEHRDLPRADRVLIAMRAAAGLAVIPLDART